MASIAGGSQRQSPPYSQLGASTQATQATQSSLPLVAGSPLLQGGAGRLHNLHASIIDETGCIVVSSRYKLPSGPPTPSKRGNHKASSPPASALGSWQVIVSRAVEGSVGWYTAQWEGQQLKSLLDRSVKTLVALETKCFEAFKAKQLTVDLPYGPSGSMTLCIGNATTKQLPLSIKLIKESDSQALLLATYTAVELCRQSEGRRQLLDSTQAKLDQSRKLAGVAPPSQPAKVDSSLVNPGRIKRKRDDDEGFEGDDEEVDQGEDEDEDEEMIKAPSRAENGVKGGEEDKRDIKLGNGGRDGGGSKDEETESEEEML